MDNEPEWWYGVHIDIYQQPATYDDMMARNLKWRKRSSGGPQRAGHRAGGRRLARLFLLSLGFPERME